MRERIDISGVWDFAFQDDAKLEINYKDNIKLPATTEVEMKGDYRPDSEQDKYLSRKYPYTGKAYYRKVIMLPAEWAGARVFLHLERTKYTDVYVNEKWVSVSNETLIPQEHELTQALHTGLNIITIVVDNDLVAQSDFPSSLMRGHQYTDHTQTNWNGILGQIYLEKRNKSYIKCVQVIPDDEKQKMNISISLESINNLICIQIGGHRNDGVALVSLKCEISGTDKVNIEYQPEDAVKFWDEFNPYFYNLNIQLIGGEEILDEYSVSAYMQKKDKAGKQLRINNRVLSLRGTVDCCIFPGTGAAPMDKATWLKLFELIKSYGLNHYRFHSWCPPDAAFAAADQIGIYLQVELSNFANALFCEGENGFDKSLDHYLSNQSEKVLRQYGNHPSFLIYAVGNEMIGNPAAFQILIEKIRLVRPDKFYTQGANNFLEEPICNDTDDCWIIMRTDQNSNIRASYSSADIPLGYLQTDVKPSTMNNYERGAVISPIPLISHEVGQYQTYPDYKEIEKYTGVLSPENLKIFRKRLEKAGMSAQAEDFHRASGKLAVQCYREEIEANLRTEGMTGFQLLGLQDFPGQGTALVGVLNSFFESKGFIQPDEWRQFCAPQVLLAEFPRYVWTEQEVFQAEIKIYNYGNCDVEGELEIVFTDAQNKWISGTKRQCLVKKDQVKNVGHVTIPIPMVKKAEEIKLRLQIGELKNSYSLWVYIKEDIGDEISKDVLVTTKLTDVVLEQLQAGESVVLLNGNANKTYSISGSFAPDFWCYPMFKPAAEAKGVPVSPGTLGMLCDPMHPALKEFPTKSYSQWQWHTLLYHSRPIILDDLNPKCHPIVQVIDNFDRNHKLGFLFEGRIGKGKLLICACNILDYLDHPEVKQLYYSILEYTKSESFVPEEEFAIDQLKRIFA